MLRSDRSGSARTAGGLALVLALAWLAAPVATPAQGRSDAPAPAEGPSSPETAAPPWSGSPFLRDTALTLRLRTYYLLLPAPLPPLAPPDREFRNADMGMNDGPSALGLLP